jgi:hypothetical protein
VRSWPRGRTASSTGATRSRAGSSSSHSRSPSAARSAWPRHLARLRRDRADGCLRHPRRGDRAPNGLPVARSSRRRMPSTRPVSRRPSTR